MNTKKIMEEVRKQLPQIASDVLQERLKQADADERKVKNQQKTLDLQLRSLDAKDEIIQERESEIESLQGRIEVLERDIWDQEDLEEKQRRISISEEVLQLREQHLQEMREWTMEMYRIPFANRVMRETTYDLEAGKTVSREVDEG